MLVRCDKPIVSFCVVSDRDVHFDPENMDLEEGREINFDYPEDTIENVTKRGRKPKKKTYCGIVVQKSCKNFSAPLCFFISKKFFFLLRSIGRDARRYE